MSAIADGSIDLRRLVVERIAFWAGLPEEDVTGDRTLAEFGLSSREAVAIAGELAHAVGRELPTTLLWEAPTVDALVTLLGGAAPGPQAQHTNPGGAPALEPVAVVGVCCRLPGGVHGPEDYWRLLVDGTDAITQVSPGRHAGEGEGEGTVTERLIRHLAAVTGHRPEHISPDIPLAALGLDSDMAVRLREAAVREFGVPLALSELLRAGTVQAAADMITLAPHDDRWTCMPIPMAAPRPVGRALPYSLRALQPVGDDPPLILVHAAGGTPDVYRPLAGFLAPGQPVYGLDRVEEAETVASMARLCAEAIREAWPDGRYRIGGWAFGGFVAQEAARLLAAELAPPDAVVLIDAVRPLPRAPGRTAWEVAREHFEGFTAYVARTYGAWLDLPYEELAGLDDRGRIGRVLEALSAVTDIPPAALRHQRDSYLDLRAGEAHTPGSYDGRVILYRATGRAPQTVRDPAHERVDDDLGWAELCPDLEVVRIPGHHLSLLDPPHAQTMADHLNRVLGRRPV